MKEVPCSFTDEPWMCHAAGGCDSLPSRQAHAAPFYSMTARKDGHRNRIRFRFSYREEVSPAGKGIPAGPVRLRLPDWPDGRIQKQEGGIMPNTIITSSGRTREEITASVRLHMRNMVGSALEIGADLIEMKEACQHGEWLPWLKEIGLSSSTAANYMRIAREIGTDSRIAQLPYTKILALMAAPKEDREALAEAADSMSAAEIRRLTDERNRAAEAANAETARADRAENDAKMFNQEASALRVQLQTAEKKIDGLRNELNGKAQYAEELRAQLLVAENNRVEVEVEKIPDDYEDLKRQKKELIEAAAEAEERAAAAEAELEEARAGAAQNGPSDFEKMHFAMKTFLMQQVIQGSFRLQKK